MLDVTAAPVEEHESQVERRRWPRLPIAVPVFIRGIDDSGKQFMEFASALNVSAGGMLVMSRRNIPVLRGLMLEIPAAPLPASRAIAGSVSSFMVKVARNLAADRGHVIAFEFTHPVSSTER